MLPKTFSTSSILSASDTGVTGSSTGESETNPPVSPAPTEGVVTEPAAPVEGEQEVKPAEPKTFEPKPGPKLPGTEADETNWLRSAVSELSRKYQAATQQLEEYQSAGLDDDERERLMLQKERQALQQEKAQLQVQYANGQWKAYYEQFETPSETLTGDDPVQWQHNVLGHLHRERQTLGKQVEQLNKKIEALKTAAKPADVETEPVGSGAGGSSSGIKTIDEVDWADLDKLQTQAISGFLKPEDYPAIPK
jgi:hypothetical protein